MAKLEPEQAGQCEFQTDYVHCSQFGIFYWLSQLINLCRFSGF